MREVGRKSLVDMTGGGAMACKWCDNGGTGIVTTPQFFDGWDVELLPPAHNPCPELNPWPDTDEWTLCVDTYGKFKKHIMFPVEYCPWCGRKLPND